MIYCRISKDREDETSTATQERACRDFVSARGWTLAGVEIDRGRSAYKADTNRPGLDRAMKLLATGAADTLVVWKLDRFVRSITQFVDRWRELNERGAQFASVTDNFDTSTGMGQAMLEMAVVFAKLESSIKADRINAWHAERRRTGATPTGPRPFGYRRVGGGLEVDVNEAAELRKAADAVLAGESLSSIVRDFNARGVPTAGTRGTWGLPTLRKVLIAPTTGGYRELDGALLPGAWEPAIDSDVWRRVRSTLTDPKRRTSPGNQRAHLLTGGIMTCGECGGSFRGRHAKTWKHPRYVCRECSQSVPLAAVDDIVTTAVLNAIDAKAWDKMCRARRASTIDPDALEAELAELAAMYAAEEMTFTEWRVMRQGITDRIAFAKQQPVELPAVDDLHAAWGTLSVDARLLVVDAVIESITVNRGRALGPHFDTERIQIEWRV